MSHRETSFEVKMGVGGTRPGSGKWEEWASNGGQKFSRRSGTEGVLPVLRGGRTSYRVFKDEYGL